jgi:hypothetical protein
MYPVDPVKDFLRISQRILLRMYQDDAVQDSVPGSLEDVSS